jgi:hypothetical protein
MVWSSVHLCKYTDMKSVYSRILEMWNFHVLLYSWYQQCYRGTVTLLNALMESHILLQSE